MFLMKSSQEQMEIYKKETGAKEIEMFQFQEFVTMKVIEEVATELEQ